MLSCGCIVSHNAGCGLCFIWNKQWVPPVSKLLNITSYVTSPKFAPIPPLFIPYPSALPDTSAHCMFQNLWCITGIARLVPWTTFKWYCNVYIVGFQMSQVLTLCRLPNAHTVPLIDCYSLQRLGFFACRGCMEQGGFQFPLSVYVLVVKDASQCHS